MADIVRNNQKVFLSVQELAFIEQISGEDFSKEAISATSGAVQYQHRIGSSPTAVFLQLTHGTVVYSKLWQSIPVIELEVFDDKIVLYRFRPRWIPRCIRHDS